MLEKQPRHYWGIDLCFLTLALGLLYMLLMGERPLFVPDEGRYAEIAREMASSGNFVTPYLDGVKYFEKPALFYWLTAIAIKAFGVTIWAVRLPGALLGLLGCLFTYVAVRKLFDRPSGLLAAAILGTSMLYFLMSNMVSLDLPVTVFISSTLYCFLLSIQASGSTRRNFMWGAAVFAALAVLTKGLIGIVFPGMIIFAWLACTNQWRLLRQLFLPSSVLIFLLVVTPWHLLVGHQHPEFFYFYFIEQQFLRYTQKDIGHYQPVWFFIPAFIAGFFPWIVFLPQTCWHTYKRLSTTSSLSSPRRRGPIEIGSRLRGDDRDEHKTVLFMSLWFILIFIFFSFSKSKLIPYILPVFPPAAILTANYLKTNLTSQTLTGIKIGNWVLLFLIILMSVFSYQFLHHATIPNPLLAKQSLVFGLSCLMLGAIIALFFLRKPIIWVSLIIVSTGLFMLSTLLTFTAIDTRTILPLATTLNQQIKPQDEVITYNQYYQDLPFYLQRRVSILNWQNELTYGMQHQANVTWLLNDDDFWKKWTSQQRIFVIMTREHYQQWQQTLSQKPFLIDQTLTNVLISNQKF